LRNLPAEINKNNQYCNIKRGTKLSGIAILVKKRYSPSWPHRCQLGPHGYQMQGRGSGTHGKIFSGYVSAVSITYQSLPMECKEREGKEDLHPY
jgi:hypothetical protein